MIKSDVLILLFEQTLTAGHIKEQYNSSFYENTFSISRLENFWLQQWEEFEGQFGTLL